MANVIIDDTNLKNIAGAIREKNGSTETYKPNEMPQAILDIVSGGGASYTSIVYNDDDTITLIDTDGTEHTMVCTYEDDVLVSVSYDGKAIDLVYEGDVLKSVGKTEVDLSNAPQTTATTIKADSSVVSVVLPVYAPTVTAEIKSNIVADSSASLEE